MIPRTSAHRQTLGAGPRRGQSGCRGPVVHPRLDVRQIPSGRCSAPKSSSCGSDAARPLIMRARTIVSGVDLAVDDRAVHQVERLVVVPEQARLDVEPLPELSDLRNVIVSLDDDGVPAAVGATRPRCPSGSADPTGRGRTATRSGRCSCAASRSMSVGSVAQPDTPDRGRIDACPRGAAAPWRARWS